jgi:hypothetical protein
LQSSGNDQVTRHMVRNYGEHCRIRVLVSTDSSPPQLELVSTLAMSWEECFAHFFPECSVARVMIKVDDLMVEIEHPNLLCKDDIITVVFDDFCSPSPL